ALLSVALEAKPLSSLDLSQSRSIARGVQAGAYFYAAVASSVLGQPFSMKRCANLVALELKELWGGLGAKTQKQFDNQVWPEYRPVAHFWAAFLHESTVVAPGRYIPCETTALPRFLRLAESFRRLGAKTRTRGRGTNGASRVLLPAASSIVLPSSIAGVPLTAPSFPDWLVDYS